MDNLQNVKTTQVSFEEYTGLGFEPPSNYCIRTADGDFTFIHCRERRKAERWVKEHYGDKYKVRVG